MRCRVCGSDLPEGALFCGDCGSSVNASRLTQSIRDDRPSDTMIVEPLPGPAVAGPRPAARPEPVSEETTVERREPFVLEASTGERIEVGPGGLLGRRPIAQPGETPERLVPLADPTRSVSKTHLEFGREAGSLWICDRYSANGTVVVTPDGQRRPCEPGVRYRVERGTIVEIGDQTLTVS